MELISASGGFLNWTDTLTGRPGAMPLGSGSAMYGSLPAVLVEFTGVTPAGSPPGPAPPREQRCRKIPANVEAPSGDLTLGAFRFSSECFHS